LGVQGRRGGEGQTLVFLYFRIKRKFGKGPGNHGIVGKNLDITMRGDTDSSSHIPKRNGEVRKAQKKSFVFRRVINGWGSKKKKHKVRSMYSSVFLGVKVGSVGDDPIMLGKKYK